ncbi:MAG: NUDIX domain-containing protein [Candidatus Kapaibacterium sp.]
MPIYRIAKPATPPKHLVTYFVVVDLVVRSILLVNHRSAQKWLPTGGHVELNEDPIETVKREMLEELGVPARFSRYTNHTPLFLTTTQTVGLTAGHTDVTLWYVLEASIADSFAFDKNEFSEIRWFAFEEILDREIAIFDPHMQRFVRKLIAMIEVS